MDTKELVIGKYSLYTAKLIELLTGTDKQLISDAELEACCGFDTRPGERGYGFLQSALRHVMRESRRHWCRARGEGCIKLLGPGETRDNVQQDQRHLRKTARRSLVKLNTVKTEQLSDDKKREYYAQAAQMGTIALVADTKTRKALEDMTAPKPLDFKGLLEGFKSAT
jgi:hypothetical protein